MEEKIKEYILKLGVDDVGFANVDDYKSPKSYEIIKFLLDAKSIIVLAFWVLSSEDVCIHCNLCVKNSLPYGIGTDISFPFCQHNASKSKIS